MLTPDAMQRSPCQQWAENKRQSQQVGAVHVRASSSETSRHFQHWQRAVFIFMMDAIRVAK